MMSELPRGDSSQTLGFLWGMEEKIYYCDYYAMDYRDLGSQTYVKDPFDKKLEIVGKLECCRSKPDFPKS